MSDAERPEPRPESRDEPGRGQDGGDAQGPGRGEMHHRGGERHDDGGSRRDDSGEVGRRDAGRGRRHDAPRRGREGTGRGPGTDDRGGRPRQERRGEREGTGRIRHGGQARRSEPGRRSAQRPSERGRHGDPARRLAYDTLRAVADGAYANLDLPQRLRGARLDARDAAFATELVYGVTRLRGRYDAIIAQCAGRPLERIDPPVLDVLRLGAHQVLGMRVPAHAAVDATVGLARGVVGAGASAFTNAVLRRISEKSLDEWLAIVAPTAPPPADTTSSPIDTTWTPTDTAPLAAETTSSAADVSSSTKLEPAGAAESPTTPDASAAPPGPLPNLDDVAVAYSHPVWIVRALRHALLADGVSTTESVDGDLLELLEADNTPADVTLVARPGLAELDELLEAGARPGALSPVGAILESGGDPGRLPAVREGRAAVQDEGSQLLVLALVAAYDASIAAATTTATTDPPAEAARWLDLCAGPGGKAALLAALAIPRGATLFCNEIGEHRADLVESAVGAAMDAGAEVFVGVGDGRTIGAEEPASFDLVLLDAPCTGLGALRRRPDARWRRTPADVADLIALQEELLASGLDALRPGGVLGYATCSPHDAETRQVVERVIRDRDNVELLDANAFLREVVIDATPLGQRAANGPFAQLWPHVHATDAMFLALIRRNAE